MRIQRTLAAAAGVAGLLSGYAAFAQGTTAVVPGESIHVRPLIASETFHGQYVTENDASLLRDTIVALDNDRAMNGAVVTVVADHGTLVANGMTTDVAQASRLEMKLKGIHGGTRVFAWFDSPAGG